MRDLTQGSPAKQILFFTIPLVIGNLFQQLYNFSDTVIVGQTLGVKSLAAVGATGSIMFLILGFVQGLRLVYPLSQHNVMVPVILQVCVKVWPQR